MQKKIIIPVLIVMVVGVSWFLTRAEEDDTVELFTKARVGEFVVDVTTTGELRAKQSTEIKGPQGVRDFRINSIRIQRLIPEGTIVKEGDFVAELDRSEIMGKLKICSHRF